MGIKIYRPTSAGRRGMSVATFEELTPNVQPERSLLTGVRKRAGRNHQGRITVRHPVSYTHLRAHETVLHLGCRLLLDKKQHYNNTTYN